MNREMKNNIIREYIGKTLTELGYSLEYWTDDGTTWDFTKNAYKNVTRIISIYDVFTYINMRIYTDTHNRGVEMLSAYEMLSSYDKDIKINYDNIGFMYKNEDEFIQIALIFKDMIFKTGFEYLEELEKKYSPYDITKVDEQHVVDIKETTLKQFWEEYKDIEIYEQLSIINKKLLDLRLQGLTIDVVREALFPLAIILADWIVKKYGGEWYKDYIRNIGSEESICSPLGVLLYVWREKLVITSELIENVFLNA